jgi:hypothetical protein
MALTLELSHTEVIENERIAMTEINLNSTSQQTIAFFESLFGKVDENGFTEIVMGQPAIFVHRILPNEKADCITLFTTGMSTNALPVSSVGTGEMFRFAELFIQLPATWPMDSQSMRDIDHRWPIEWLQSLARGPFLAGMPLTGPLQIFENDTREDTLSPNNQFTGMMLLAEKRYERTDNETCVLYRMIPLYWEESQLVYASGPQPILQALDKARSPFIVDIHRKNVAV